MLPENSAKPPHKQEGLPPVGYLVIGLFMYGAGSFLFYYFTNIEQTGGMPSATFPVILVYWLGGKWLVSVVCGLIGTTCMVIGIVGLFRSG